MPATSMVHVRVDEKIKIEATETLASMGLSVSDAVRVFLTRVAVEKQLPFLLKMPNPETHAAMMEADAIASRNKSRFANVDELNKYLSEQLIMLIRPHAIWCLVCRVILIKGISYSLF